MGCSASVQRATVEAKAPTFGNFDDLLSDYKTEAGPYAHTDRTKESTIIYSKQGIASKEELEPTTFPALMLRCKNEKGQRVAFRTERPLPPVSQPEALPLAQWKAWTYEQYYEECYAAAKAFISFGHQTHDAVNVWGFNAPEWIMGQNAAIFAGGMVAGLYPTDTPDQIQYKVAHSGSSAICVEDMKKVKTIGSMIDKMPKLKVIVVWDPAAEVDVKEFTRGNGEVVPVVTWDELVAKGKEQPNDEVDARLAGMKPTNCCALIYTSGTTGNPKAVMISHDNIIFEASVVLQCVPILGVDPNESERILSYLPLSHVAGMLIDIVAPLMITATRASWCELYFARNYDLKAVTIGERLRACRPTMFLGVPRVWEKFMGKLKAAGKNTKGAKKKVVTWAKGKAAEHSAACQLGGTGEFPSNYGMANKLLGKIKAVLGLDKCKFALTGAAPITTETLEYFGSLGIQINEVYGMSECTGATTWSTDSAHVWGSCGWAIPGGEVKCFKVDGSGKKTECPLTDDMFNAKEEEQGEICFRGRHIMMGYLANPDFGADHVAEIKKKTEESIDSEGWLHSGDKGCIDKAGMVKITGRYKELIIGSGGENIAPVPIEDGIKAACPGISNIMMVGDKRKFNVAVLTLKAEGATMDLPGGDDLTGEALTVNPETKTVSAAIKDPVWHKYIFDAIVEVNKGLTPPCRIQRFSILPRDFSVETEELTPTYKLKRSVTEKKYNATIEALYSETAATTDYYFECVI